MVEVHQLPLRRRNHRAINDVSTDPPILDPIVGYAHERPLSLLEACQPLTDVVDDILNYVSIALQMSPEQPPDELTQDGSAAIRLYTMEWDDQKLSLYSILNRTLRTEHHDKLRPWFKYLTLFLTALVKIPCAPPQIVWRGVAQDISDQFPRGTAVTWWSFSSCTATLTVLENALYLGNATNRTLFSIEVLNARDVSAHSYFQTEDEILLLPGTYMEVRSQFHPAANLHIIHLRQKIPEEVLLEPPFPGANIYPTGELFKIPRYRKKRWYIPISFLVVAIVIAITLGSVLRTRSTPIAAPEIVHLCNISTLLLLTNKYETSFGLWNTTVSGHSLLSAAGAGVGKYSVTSPPQNIFDQDTGSSYISFGSCADGAVAQVCGINTGFIVMPEQGPTLLLAIRFTTSRGISASDPLTITIEGSNGTFSELKFGKSWSLIYNGSTGLDEDPGRTTNGLAQCIFNNSIQYTGYRVLVTSKRGISDSVQYSEVKLFGHGNPNKDICNMTMMTLLTRKNEVVYGLWKTSVLENSTLSTTGNGAGNYPSEDGPQLALDQNSATKYLNFGNCSSSANQIDCGTNTGFYVTPRKGPTLLLAIQFTTAFDYPSRDPLSITVEGSNATSSELMLGTSWSLIYTVLTGLDDDPGRQIDGLFQCLPINTIWYTSYRILVTSKRDTSSCVQYSEVKLFGYEDICNVTMLPILTENYEIVYELWNTTVAGDSLLSTSELGVGRYNATSSSRNILDQNSANNYISFGSCVVGKASNSCGIDTGFIVVPLQGATLLLGIQFTTNTGSRASDPLTITIEGSNETLSALMFGRSWSLIYKDSTGLDIDPGRSMPGVDQCIKNNTIWYTSYRVLVTSKRDISDSVQYSEVKLFGRQNPNRGSCNTTVMTRLTGIYEVVYGLWNTTFLGNSTLAIPGSGNGRYIPGEVPRYTFDQNITTKYTSFGNCPGAIVNEICGINTGFYVTPQQGPTLLLGIQFTTANDFSVRDPISITIEGSNATSSALLLGKSWSLIGSVSTGLEVDPGRKTDGIRRCLPNNVIWYTSYRILIMSLRDAADCVQYSEVKLFGFENPNKDICSTAQLSLLTDTNEVVYGLWNTTELENGTLATAGDDYGNYISNEAPQYALDQNITTKYASFGYCPEDEDYCGVKTGFYVTPRQGPTLLLGIQFTTANDFPDRDPLSVTIEGSNATSSVLLLGTSWSLISSVSTGLEVDPGRKTDGIFRCLPNNSVWYTSYRILVRTIQHSADCVQYSEVKLFGYRNPSKIQNSSMGTI